MKLYIYVTIVSFSDLDSDINITIKDHKIDMIQNNNNPVNVSGMIREIKNAGIYIINPITKFRKITLRINFFTSILIKRFKRIVLAIKPISAVIIAENITL